MDVPHVYVSPPAGARWEAPKRLAAFRKLDLAPGASTTVTAAIDPRLLATFGNGQWRIAAGDYKLILAASSRDLGETATIRVPAQVLPASWRP
jgi:beta-glucosidase